MKIKAVFFDFEGVITKDGRICHSILFPSLKKWVSLEELYKRYEEGKYGLLNEKDFFKGIPKEHRYNFLKKVKYNKGTKQTVEKIGKKIKVFIASNHVKCVFESELKKLGCEKLFNKIFMSAYIKLAKPDKDFFYYMLKKTKLNSKNCIFVDDAKRNLIPAKEIGFITVWMNTKTFDVRNENNFKADFEIQNMKELIKIVNTLNLN